MRKLSKRFLVSPTPEAYTSKTCSRCFGDCGPCSEMEDRMGKKIRGLRRCTQRDCMLFLNRDKNGATNIGTNFTRLFEDKSPIRSMTDEDLDFHRASLCFECADQIDSLRTGCGLYRSVPYLFVFEGANLPLRHLRDNVSKNKLWPTIHPTLQFAL